MDGWTLDTIDEPEGMGAPERIDAELERLTGGELHGLPLLPDDPSWLVRVGDDRESVLCDEMSLLERLASLPTGSASATVWLALREEARDPTERPH